MQGCWLQAFALAIPFLLTRLAPCAQQLDDAAIIHDLDAANQSRYDHVLGFSDVEHYVVFRGSDDVHPAAEMTVRVTYRKGVGKTYEILTQSGSDLVIKYGLRPLLDNEKALNDPAHVAQSWFASANYDMKLKPGVTQTIDGRPCIALAITPLRKAPNMIEGTLWVDTRDHTLAEVEGIASKSPSVFSGNAHMMRLYSNMQGYAMATHARAESHSMLFGRTVVIIDYRDYQFQIQR